MSQSGRMIATQRATIDLRSPAITLLFEATSWLPISQIADATGSVRFDAATNSFSVQFSGSPEPGTQSLIKINYTDGSSDTLTISY